MPEVEHHTKIAFMVKRKYECQLENGKSQNDVTFTSGIEETRTQIANN